MNNVGVIVMLGEPMVEFAQIDPGNTLAYHLGFGGDTSNAAVSAARQGARVRYLTRLGRDDFGRALMDLWTEEGIDAHLVSTDDALPTAHYFVKRGADGHQFSYSRRGSAASAMTPDWLPATAFENAAILHISGISQAISDSACDTVFDAIEMAQAAGVPITYDPNVRLRLWSRDRARAIIAATVAIADVVLPSTEDMSILLGDDRPDAQIDWCLALGASTVVLKLGREGCIVATSESRQAVASFPVDLVDGTGAGDCFDGAFLARWVGGDSMVDAAQYGCAAASLAVQGIGAVSPIPRAAQVHARLACRSV